MAVRLDYGGANFLYIRENRLYYVDRTSFIDKFEKVNSRFLIFLRPRRFGKSLWISILDYYYGLQHKDKFDMLFGDLAIGKSPTISANQYLMLKFNFSGIESKNYETTYNGFLSNVKSGVNRFFSDYGDFFSQKEKIDVLEKQEPEHVIQTLFNYSKELNIKIYILIDEYDHFANELISFNLALFQEIVSRNGWVRKFYETIKEATEEGIVGRFFATGVSPITLDSMTSGFNVTNDLSLEMEFNEVLGFTNKEVEALLLAIGVLEQDLVSTMQDLYKWYNGYLFHPRGEQKVFNPTMVLYFAKAFLANKEYPEVMLDTNIASDYGKIKKLFHIGFRQESDNYSILYSLLQGKTTYVLITRQFSFDLGFSEDDLMSLLFYMGFLTADKSRGQKWSLKFPNKVIESLYQKFFIESVERRYGLNRSFTKLSQALDSFYWSNDPMPFLNMIAEVMKKDLSNRDAIRMNEKDLKYLIISYLHLSPEFFIKSEYEVERKYNDILLLRRKPFDMPHNYLIELKYFKVSLTDKELEAEKTKAVEQVKNYLKTQELTEFDDLKAWLWFAIGSEWVFVKEIEGD